METRGYSSTELTQKSDVCDFCDSKMPLWTVLCSKEIVTLPPIVIVQSKDWAACNHCVEFIKQKNIEGLLDYIASKGNFPVSEKFRENLKWMYKEIIESIVSIKEDGLESLL